MHVDRNQVIGTAAVLLAMALVVLDAGITNVALPTISASLEVQPSRVILVTSAYQLALLIGLLPAAHIAGRTGTRMLFVVGLCTFTVASLLAATAANFAALVAVRFLQGVGGAAILALGIPLMRASLGRDRLGAAIGWNALNVAICAAAGPAIAALVLAAADWPWLFILNLPVGLIALAASMALPRDSKSKTAVDAPSILLHTASAALLFLAAQSLIAAPIAAALLVSAAAATITFLFRRELSKPAPLLPLDLMSDRPFRLAVGASILCFIAQSAGQIALPFYLQHNLRENALVAAAVMACWPIAIGLSGQVATRLAFRTGAGILCAIGTFILAAGLAAMALLQPGVGPLAFCTAICGVGFGLFQVPNNRKLFFTAPEERSEAAGGMQATARLAGQTSGAMLVSFIFSRSPTAAAPHIAFTVAAVFALGSATLSLRQLKRPQEGAAACKS